MSQRQPGRQVRRPNANIEPGYQPYYQRSPGHRPQWSTIWRLSLAVIILAGLAASAGIGFNIRHVSSEGSRYAAEIVDNTRAELKSHWLWRNLLLLPPEQLKQQLLERQGEQITEVKVRKQWLGRGIVISAQDRAPSLEWQSAGQLFAVDQTGRLINRLDKRGSSPLVIDSSNVSINLNDQVVSRQFVNFVTAAYQALPSAGLTPSQGRIGDTTSELTIDTTAGFYIRFDTNRGASEQVDAVKAVLAEASAKNAKPAKYIDVRIPYKAYYQ